MHTQKVYRRTHLGEGGGPGIDPLGCGAKDAANYFCLVGPTLRGGQIGHNSAVHTTIVAVTFLTLNTHPKYIKIKLVYLREQVSCFTMFCAANLSHFNKFGGNFGAVYCFSGCFNTSERSAQPHTLAFLAFFGPF